MQDESFQPACLFQRPDLFTDTADEIEVEVLQHGGNHHEHHVLNHEGKGQVRPSEVVVLYVEVLFARNTFVVERDDVFLGRCPVVGEDAAVCVYQVLSLKVCKYSFYSILSFHSFLFSLSSF